MRDFVKQSWLLTENQKPAWYSPSSALSPDDEKWILENISEKKSNEGLSVSGNDTSKRNAAFESTQNKKRAIAALKNCNYRTSPEKIASLLEEVFSSYNTKPGHWLYIAQHWPPRPINRVIAYIIKRHQSGWETISNPAAYFTWLIKRRKRRRVYEHQW